MTPDTHRRWVRLYIEERLSLETLAERSGVSASTVRTALLKAGVTLRAPTQGPQGAASAKTRNEEIRARWAKGEPIQTIAVALGTTSSAIYYAAKRLRLPRRA